jgi:UDP-N-acetylmuramate--alanine ligase
VVEADEYDRSFLTLQPSAAVVTSVEADHLDIYGDLSGIEAAFAEFLLQVRPGGVVAICIDDAGARRIAAQWPATRTC